MPLPLPSFTPTQLEDPLVLGWLLDRLTETPPGREAGRIAELRTLLPPERLARLLLGVDKRLARRACDLLSDPVPPPVVERLVAAWPSVDKELLPPLSERLARLAPDPFAARAEQWLDGLERSPDFAELLALLQAIPELASRGAALVRRVRPLVQACPEGATLEPELTVAVAAAGLPEAVDLLLDSLGPEPASLRGEGASEEGDTPVDDDLDDDLDDDFPCDLDDDDLPDDLGDDFLDDLDEFADGFDDGPITEERGSPHATKPGAGAHEELHLARGGPGRGWHRFTHLFDALAARLPFLEEPSPHPVDTAGEEPVFASLALLFRPRAPLGELDRLDRLDDASARLASALALLPAEASSPLALLARRLAERQDLAPRATRAASDLVLAAVAEHYFQGIDRERVAAASAAEMLDVALRMPLSLAEMEPLLAELLRRDREALRARLEGALETWLDGGASDPPPLLEDLLGLVGRLADAELVAQLPALADVLDADEDLEWLEDALALAGPVAEDALLELWEEGDDTEEQWRWLRPLTIVGGERTVELLLAVLPEMKRTLLGLGVWCAAASRIGDHRLLDALRPELRRGLVEVDETVAILGALACCGDEDVRKARERYEEAPPIEDRCPHCAREAERRRLRGQTLQVALRCGACAEENRYAVDVALVDTADLRAGIYTCQELCCSSCGQAAPFWPVVDDPALPVPKRRLLIEIFEEQGDEGPRGALSIRHGSFARGRAPWVAAEAAARRLREHPDDAEQLLVLTRFFLECGPMNHARRYLDACLVASPSHGPARLGLAELLLAEGRATEALELLDQCYGDRYRWQGLATLYGKKERFWQEFEKTYRRAAAAAGRPLRELAPPTAANKIGRNDPCPCGSGRKYKKCCLQ